MESALAIPTVNLADVDSDDSARAARAAAALREGFGTYGLIYVDGHSIERERVDAMYAAYQKLCAEPESLKRTLGGPDIWYQRGWTPPNTEKAVVAGGQPDFKECYFAAPEPLDPVCQAQYPQTYCDNVWPEGHDEFQSLLMGAGQQLHEIGQVLLRGCARALELPTQVFEKGLEGGAHVTRVLRYLPLNDAQVGRNVLWGEEHTDFNLLTLLPGGRFYDPEGALAPRPDDQAGLYLRTRASAEHPQGQMVRGVPPAGCVVVQVGQQLEILTGGTFTATPHIIKPPALPGWSRCSSAHFMHLHAHQMLFPLQPFRNDDTIRAYSPPVLAGTYGLKTLVDIGLAPPEALDSLGYRQYDRLAGFRERESGE